MKEKNANGKISDTIFRKIIMHTYFVVTQSNNVFGVINISYDAGMQLLLADWFDPAASPLDRAFLWTVWWF